MNVATIMLNSIDDAQTVQTWLDNHTNVTITHIQVDSAVCWIFYTE